MTPEEVERLRSVIERLYAEMTAHSSDTLTISRRDAIWAIAGLEHAISPPTIADQQVSPLTPHTNTLRKNEV